MQENEQNNSDKNDGARFFGWKLHGDGKTLMPGEVVNPDERLSWTRTTSIGLQHIVAMFGATFLVPLLTGFSPATTLFFSAIATILFLIITRNKVPSYLGSSFAFIAPIIAAKAGGLGVAVFGILATGILLAVIGLIVTRVGPGWINRVMPPVVTGTIVALIGFNLAPAAYNNFTVSPITAMVTLCSVVLIAALFKGIIGRLSILLGVIIGYVCAIIRGEVDFSSINEAAWIGLPDFTLPIADFSILPMFLPVVLVLIAENVGHIKSVSVMTGKNLDRSIGWALFSDGLGTTLAGIGGGSGTTTYAENIGVMAATKVYSTAAYWVAGAGALVLSLCPKFGAAVASVPSGVLGGVTVLLYGMIGMLGVRIWVENRVDFSKPINITTAAIPLVIGIADFTFQIGDSSLTGIAIGSIAALVIFHLIFFLNRLRGIDVDIKQSEKDFVLIEGAEDVAEAIEETAENSRQS
ncbi:MAG: NCS2 family nucleobase:cation symporter [Coriobacteriales bacterium]|jgi:uracil-xanthine permease|nr:NCS2 family nucleobase:cation symporter [Coriobacteriales bacterium]